MGNNGLRNGSTGTNVVQTSHNFLFNNVVINASIASETYGTQNYYSQTYQSGGSLSTAGVEAFFNSTDITNTFLQDVNSGLALIVQNASTSNGAAIVTGAPTGLGNDQWRLFPTDSGFFKITNQRSGLVLAVQSASTNAGAKIIQWTFGSAKNDQWMPLSAGNGFYNFVNRLSGLYLDVAGASPLAGAQLTQQSPDGGANQQFKFATMLNLPRPVIDNLTLSGNSIIISGSGGIPGGAFDVLTSTNVGLSLNQWTMFATNSFDPNGNFNVTNSTSPGSSQQFFRIRTL
jgi:hypothetical protein